MNKPVALIYDFDKTLSTTDMQNFGFIPSLGIDIGDFWREVDDLAEKQEMDPVLAYLYVMLEKSNEKGKPVTRESLNDHGKSIQFFPGVSSWFSRINEFAEKMGLALEHYVISSGSKEIIEGCDIYSAFKQVYGCEYLYRDGQAVWPKMAVNYTNKTQFLFRINKGVLEISDDKKVNTFVCEEERRIPFSRIIYIGDGLTDVPCMRLVRQNGGHSIAVFSAPKKDVAVALIQDERVDFATEADYTEGRELDNIVKTVLTNISMEQRLEELHRKHKKIAEG